MRKSVVAQWREQVVVHTTGWIIGVGLFLLPLLYLLMISLRSQSGFLAHPLAIPHTLHFSNYASAWKRASMARYFINSIIYSVGGSILSVLLAVFLAFPISRGYIRGSNIVYQVFVYAMFLPGSIIPLFVESRVLHLYNNPLGYIILHVGTELAVFFFVGYIKSVPRELDEAAAMDGCGYMRYMLFILIPLMRPALATMGLLSFIGEWNNLIGPIVFLPSQKYWPLTRGLLVFYGQYTNDWPLLAAGLIISILPLTILFLLMQRQLVAGLTGGSLKL